MEGNFVMAFLSLFLIFLLSPLCLISANMEGDALHNLRTNLQDPNNVLQSWDPTLVNPCTWFHVLQSWDPTLVNPCTWFHVLQSWIFMQFEDDSLEFAKTMKQWNVKIISISKNKRHQDRTAVLDVWEKLEDFVWSQSHS